MRSWSPSRQVAATLALLTVVRFVLAGQVELTSHETYYWLYGKHPAAGYYDHPPLIGWMIWLSTTLFGDGPLAVRLLSVIGGSLGAWLTFLAARRLYDERIAR